VFSRGSCIAAPLFPSRSVRPVSLDAPPSGSRFRRFGYFPFGACPRACPFEAFAMVEARLFWRRSSFPGTVPYERRRPAGFGNELRASRLRPDNAGPRGRGAAAISASLKASSHTPIPAPPGNVTVVAAMTWMHAGLKREYERFSLRRIRLWEVVWRCKLQAAPTRPSGTSLRAEPARRAPASPGSRHDRLPYFGATPWIRGEGRRALPDVEAHHSGGKGCVTEASGSARDR